MNTLEKNSEMFARIAEHGDTWEARERHMLEGIVKKVELATVYKNAVEGIELEDSEEVIRAELEAAHKKIANQYPPEVSQALLEAETAIKKFRELQAKKETLQKSEPQDKGEIGEVDKQLGELERQAGDLLKSYDVGFLLILKESIAKLIDKNRKIRAYLADQTSMLRDAAGQIGQKKAQKFLGMKPVSVEYQPFSVNITLPPEDYQTLGISFRKSNGLHFTDSPFNIIRNTDEWNRRRTVKHENNHNLIDTISTIGYTHPFERLSHYFEQSSKPELRDEERAEYRKKILEATPSTVIDWMHEEILAAAFSEEDGGFLKNRDLTAKPRSRVHKFGLVTAGFSTAGVDARKIIKLYRDQAKLKENADIRDMLLNFEVQFKGLFLKAVDSIKSALLVAERIDDEALDRMEVLFHILFPSQFHQARKYLEAKYGPGTVKRNEFSAKLSSDFDLHKNFLGSAVRILGDNPDVLVAGDKRSIEEKLDRVLEFTPRPRRLGIKTLKDLRDYEILLSVLARHVSSLDKLMDYYKEVQVAYFVTIAIGDDVENQFQDLPKIYEQLNEQEKDLFKQALGKSMVTVVPFILEELHHTEEFPLTEIKKQPLWKVIEQMGLTQEAEEVAKAEEEEYKRLNIKKVRLRF